MYILFIVFFIAANYAWYKVGYDKGSNDSLGSAGVITGKEASDFIKEHNLEGLGQ